MGRLSLEGETEEKATAAMKSSMVNEAKVGPAVVGWNGLLPFSLFLSLPIRPIANAPRRFSTATGDERDGRDG